MSNKLKKGLDFLGPDIIIFKKLSEARNEKELKIKNKNKKVKVNGARVQKKVEEQVGLGTLMTNSTTLVMDLGLKAPIHLFSFTRNFFFFCLVVQENDEI